MKYALIPLALLTFGCSGGGGNNGSDTAFVGDVALIQSIDWSCDQTSWTYTAFTDGLSYRVQVDVVSTQDWDGSAEPSTDDVWRESHQIFNLAEADDRGWCEYGSNPALSWVTDTTQVVEGSSTFFQCGLNNPDTLAFSVQVRDANDSVFDCAIWVHKSQAWFEGEQGMDCLCFEAEADGACGDHNDVAL